LADTGRAVDEERVVRLPGRLGDRERRGVGEAVGVADDERLEREARVDPVRFGLERGVGRSLRFTLNAPGRDDVDGCLRAEYRRGARPEDPAKAVGDPWPQARGRLHDDRVAVERHWPQRRQPEVVDVLGDRTLELALDRWPDMREVLVHG